MSDRLRRDVVERLKAMLSLSVAEAAIGRSKMRPPILAIDDAQDVQAILVDWERLRRLISTGDERALSFEARAIREQEQKRERDLQVLSDASEDLSELNRSQP